MWKSPDRNPLPGPALAANVDHFFAAAVKIAEHYKVEAVEKLEKYRAVKMQEAEASLGMLQ